MPDKFKFSVINNDGSKITKEYSPSEEEIKKEQRTKENYFKLLSEHKNPSNYVSAIKMSPKEREDVINEGLMLRAIAQARTPKEKLIDTGKDLALAAAGEMIPFIPSWVSKVKNVKNAKILAKIRDEESVREVAKKLSQYETQPAKIISKEPELNDEELAEIYYLMSGKKVDPKGFKSKLDSEIEQVSSKEDKMISNILNNKNLSSDKKEAMIQEYKSLISSKNTPGTKNEKVLLNYFEDTPDTKVFDPKEITSRFYISEEDVNKLYSNYMKQNPGSSVQQASFHIQQRMSPNRKINNFKNLIDSKKDLTSAEANVLNFTNDKIIGEYGYDATKLTPNEVSLLDNYQRGFDSEFNRRHMLSDKLSIKQQHIDQLNQAIQKNKFPSKTQVYRSTGDYSVEAQLPDGTTKTMKYSELPVGAKFKEPGFLSTTHTKPGQLGFTRSGPHYRKIEIPEGSKQSYANMTAQGLDNSMLLENESLLPKDLIFEVTGTRALPYTSKYEKLHYPASYKTLKIVNPYTVTPIIGAGYLSNK